jgi:putative ABC transport system ATP-binding protein
MLTAEENITLPLRIGGKTVDSDLFERLVWTMALQDRLDHRPAQLSGGQQQRVAIARALVSKPAVVFADEPTGNLDSSSSREVLQLMRRAVDELDQTIVMVTHDATAASFADRLLFLRDGQIVRDEGGKTVDQIFELFKEIK